MKIVIKDDSVRVTELWPAVWHAVYVYRDIRVAHGLEEDIVITSGNDGTHSFGSLHHMNRAVDLRTNDVPRGVMPTIVKQLKHALGAGFDVIWEYENLPNEHLHIEAQPKQR